MGLALVSDLRKKHRKSRVRDLQSRLIALGYSCGPAGVDGDYGRQTRASVVSFQRASGLTIDGDAGRNTWRALRKAGNDIVVASPAPAEMSISGNIPGLRKAKRSINRIVIHCSATRPSMDIGAKEIDSWHRGRGWNGIGYHFVIRRGGKIEKGRSIDKTGSHVRGYNRGSIGVSMVGGVADGNFKPENNFTKAQWRSLKRLVGDLYQLHGEPKVLGHRNFPNVAKACPSFDAVSWAKENGFDAGF